MWTLITATVFAIALFALEIYVRKHGEQSRKGRRAQLALLTLGLISTILAAAIEYSGREKKVAIEEVLEQGVDLHLGDNVYPDRYGFSHNPLHMEIYKQGVRGIVYFDKKTKNFLSDDDRPTQIGQALVNFHSTIYRDDDFSCFEWVKAHNPGDPEYERLTKLAPTSPKHVLVGPTLLTSDTDPREDNYFYDRYAAVGIGRSLNFLSECEEAGIDVSKPDKVRATVLITAYHGGIRPGQSENFEVVFNGFQKAIPSKTSRMRDPQDIAVEIPSEHLRLDRENILFLHVLPWVEDEPVRLNESEAIYTRHFRDVGITYLAIKLEEK